MKPETLDPVVGMPLALKPADRIASAGSCFAQHISRTVKRAGFNYFVAEAGDDTFSARYGNIYSARQLVQLFDRAYGRFETVDRHWSRADGRFVDPFRPQAEPEGFATPADVERSRSTHLAAVRRLFEQLDVFVFTLGLTEAWRSRSDGAVYPLAPGVAGGAFDDTLHEFVNFGVAEVTGDLLAFVDRLLTVNPRARMILTVSPVPLKATYEDRHVLAATAYSKAVLRVAAEETVRSCPMCHYFPSYEIVTGPHARGRYFDDDLRTVTAEGVDHVMRVFLAHYASAAPEPSLQADLRREQQALGSLLCEEDAIDQCV